MDSSGPAGHGTDGRPAASRHLPPTATYAAADTVRLVPNRNCEGEGHAMCWRVECRHCDDCLAAHLDVRTLRMETAQLFDAHVCPGRSDSV